MFIVDWEEKVEQVIFIKIMNNSFERAFVLLIYILLLPLALYYLTCIVKTSDRCGFLCYWECDTTNKIRAIATILDLCVFFQIFTLRDKFSHRHSVNNIAPKISSLSNFSQSLTGIHKRQSSRKFWNILPIIMTRLSMSILLYVFHA